MQLSWKWMAYWLQQAKINIICPSLVILPLSVTHSACKWASPVLLHLLSLNSALLSNLVHKYPHKLTEWPHLPSLGFHWIMSPPFTYQRPWSACSSVLCQCILIAKWCYGAVSPPFPIPTMVLCISLLLIFLMLPFISFSVPVSIKLLSTNPRFTSNTLPSPSALPSWSLILLKLQLSVKCYTTTFCPQRQWLTGMPLTGGWYLAAIKYLTIAPCFCHPTHTSVQFTDVLLGFLFSEVLWSIYLCRREKETQICKAKASNFLVRVGRSTAASKHSPTEVSDAVSNNYDKKLS